MNQFHTHAREVNDLTRSFAASASDIFTKLSFSTLSVSSEPVLSSISTHRVDRAF
jgi:hypothetical protein